MRFRTILPALLGAMLTMGAMSPAFADRDGWGRGELRTAGWQDHGWQGGGRQGGGWEGRGWQDRGWERRGWREQAWRERVWQERALRQQLWQERHALRFYNPPVVVAPGYPYSYR